MRGLIVAPAEAGPRPRLTSSLSRAGAQRGDDALQPACHIRPIVQPIVWETQSHFGPRHASLVKADAKRRPRAVARAAHEKTCGILRIVKQFFSLIGRALAKRPQRQPARAGADARFEIARIA